MTNILEQIIATKRVEVAERKALYSIEGLFNSPYYGRKGISLVQRLKDINTSGIIAEFKRKSPSKGIINATAKPYEVALSYERAGVAGMSVLTDETYFGGNFKDFKSVRDKVSIPLLRKDFIIDDYQVYETKSIGADLILLIAANLEVKQCHDLARKAKEVGLEVLLELHTEEELGHICDQVDIVGINNRNLKTFVVDLEHSIQLAAKIPDSFIKIAESGISDPKNIQRLSQHGFKGFLIGENFMKTSNPGNACQDFIEKLK